MEMGCAAPLWFQLPEKPGVVKAAADFAEEVVEVAFPFRGIGGIQARIGQGDTEIGQCGKGKDFLEQAPACF